MDIWRWVSDLQDNLVKQGHARLAELLYELPGHVVDHRHDAVDATVPEALALAKSLENPWLEVFIRHWDMQSRVLQRGEAKSSLPDAVELLDFANQASTRDCPQSVCVTQDLTSCYAQADGPAYVTERIAAAEETLQRIGPTWPCFTCISDEKADALVDAGRYEEALAFIAEQRRALEAVGELGSGDFRGHRVQALMMLRRLDEAWDINERAEHPEAGENFVFRKQIDRARLLAARGQGQAALEALPELDRIADSPALFERYAEARVGALRAGADGADTSLDTLLARMARRLEKQGCLRSALQICGQRVEAAVLQGTARSAARGLAQAERIAATLVKPLDAPEQLAAWGQAAQAVPAPPPITLPDSPEALLEEDDEGLTPGELRDRLDAAVERWPTHDGLRTMRAQAWLTEGELDEAREDLQGFVAEHPAAPDSVTLLVHLIARDGPEALDAWAAAHLARTDASEIHARVGFVRGRTWMAAGRLDKARPILEQVAASRPEALGTRVALGRLERQDSNLQQSLRWLDEALTLQSVPDVHWDRMVVATLLGRWDLVRESAAAVGMPLEPGEGRISERWGLCRIRLYEASGERQTLMALRTGPVTARILEISPPSSPQRYDDEVVFDAEPLNPRPEGEPEDPEEPYIFEYPMAQVLVPGGYTAYELDGRAPSEADEEALERTLDQHSVTLRRMSGEGYQITDAETEAEHPGAYYYLAVSEDTPPQDVLRLIQEAGWPEPWVCPSLAEAAEQPELAAEHLRTAERWGLL